MGETGLEHTKRALAGYTSVEGGLRFFESLGYPVLKPPVEFSWDAPERACGLIRSMKQVAEFDGGEGFRVYHVELDTDRFRKTEFRTVLEPFYRRFPQGEYLFAFSRGAAPYDELAFVSPRRLPHPRKEGKVRLLLRTLSTEPAQPYRTDLQVLGNILVEPGLSATDVSDRHLDAFDVEKVTKQFYKDFAEVFDKLQHLLARQSNEKQLAHDYALQFLNRILFLYFVQRKELLLGRDGSLDGRFMRHLWETYKESGQKDRFFDGWLKILFFEAFNRRFQVRREYRKRFPEWLVSSLSQAPYLNGGLFLPNRLDNEIEGSVKDSFFESLFDRWKGTPPGFLEHYNFTIAETTPLDKHVAVDPEMVGKIYERLVNVTFKGVAEQDKRGEAGIFYTPRVEIDLMCRLSLVDYLGNHLGEERKPLLYEWVFALDEEDKREADEKIRREGLEEGLNDLVRGVTVCDPACGSASFLVGMLLVLDDLQARCNEMLGAEETSYERRRRIIGDSLYGVDIMEWAVHVAELRLWLQLVVETELKPGEHLVRPLLPNLSFKVRPGDSLVQEVGGIDFALHREKLELPREFAAPILADLRKLKTDKMHYYSAREGAPSKQEIEKKELRVFQEILEAKHHELRNRIAEPSRRQQLMEFMPEELEQQKELPFWREELKRIEKARAALTTVKGIPFVWDVAFVEIFEGDKKGFDIVIGNPPYVRHQRIKDYLGRWLPREYKRRLAHSVVQAYPAFFRRRSFPARSDLYVYFYFYALSLPNPKGAFCFITSNSWLDAGYGTVLQEFLLRHSCLETVADNTVKRSFAESDVNTVIVLLAPADDDSSWGLRKQARFISFNVPFEEAVSPVIFQEIEEATGRLARKEFRCIVKPQKELLEEAQEKRDCSKETGFS